MPSYENPPLLEAVFEARFSEDSAWDLAVPGLLYAQIKDVFPNKERRAFGEVKLTRRPEGLVQEIRPGEQVIFATEDRRTEVQVSSHRVSIHHRPPYAGWQDFGPLIARLVVGVMSVIGTEKPERLGLRFINRVVIPGRLVNLDQYFDFRPYLGPSLPQTMGVFLILSQFPFVNDEELCRVQLSNALPDQPGESAILLDLDYATLKPGRVETGQIGGWVENAHSQVERLFEGCITDDLRRLFRPTESRP